MSASPQPDSTDASGSADPARLNPMLRHDVRTALTVIRGYAQLAQRRSLVTPPPERWMLVAWLQAIDAAAGTILVRLEEWEREQRR
jgi:signal transduction histidine kinase